MGKSLKHLDNREILCIHRPNVFTVSAGPGYKTFREWIRFSYNNMTDRLFAATIQTMKDHSEQMLRLNSSQLALIRVQMCTKRTDLHHIMRRFGENNVRVLHLNVSPKFALLKQVVLKVNRTQSKMSSCSNNINKCLSITNLFT